MSNEVELRYNSEPKGGRSELKNEPVSWMNKMRAGFAFVTIEPFWVCYILPYDISSLAIQRLYLEKACRVDLNYTKADCDMWDGNVTMQTKSMVNDLLTQRQYFLSCVQAIAVLFVGAWSDLTGNRKALMMVSMFGGLVSTFGLVLATYFFEALPLFSTGLIETLPRGFSGGFHVAIMGSFGYLADVTSLETRTFRMGIACAVTELIPPVALYIRGILENNVGYYGIFAVSTALYVIGMIYTYFMIHDAKPIKIEAVWYKKFKRFFNPTNAWSTISIAYKSIPDRAKILLVVAAHFIINGPIYGNGSNFYSYLSHKYRMDNAEIYIFYHYKVLIGICGILFAVTLFSRFLKLHDAILGIIVTASNVMSSFMYAFAPTTLWLYSTLVLDLFWGSWRAVILSLGTKIVAPEHIAKVYSLFSLTDAIIPLIYKPMYIKMYRNTQNIMQGAVYLLGAAMTVPAILIFILIYKQLKKEERDRVTDPQSKELYAYENCVTSL